MQQHHRITHSLISITKMQDTKEKLAWNVEVAQHQWLVTEYVSATGAYHIYSNVMLHTIKQQYKTTYSS